MKKKQEQKVESVFIKPVVKVFVGYSWDNDAHCKKDEGWTKIRDYFKPTKESLEKKYGITIDFRRLRASHGCFVWDSILSKIKAADILIFDVADKKEPKRFNQNVLLELGAAMALGDKKVLVMCPDGLLKKFPSDLSGLCLSLYAGEDKKPTDKWGLLPQFSGMVRDIVATKEIGDLARAVEGGEDDGEWFCTAQSE